MRKACAGNYRCENTGAIRMGVRENKVVEHGKLYEGENVDILRWNLNVSKSALKRIINQRK